MQRAITFDQATVKGDLTDTGTNVDEVEIEYVDNDTPAYRLREIAAQAANASSTNVQSIDESNNNGTLFNEKERNEDGSTANS